LRHAHPVGELAKIADTSHCGRENEEMTPFDAAKANKLRDTLQKVLDAFLDADAN
jgi:hypothetical protein